MLWVGSCIVLHNSKSSLNTRSLFILNSNQFFYCRRKSAQVRMKGLIEKVLGHENKSKSCENLNVIWKSYHIKQHIIDVHYSPINLYPTSYSFVSEWQEKRYIIYVPYLVFTLWIRLGLPNESSNYDLHLSWISYIIVKIIFGSIQDWAL